MIIVSSSGRRSNSSKSSSNSRSSNCSNVFFWRPVEIKSGTSKYRRRMSFESAIQVELKAVKKFPKWPKSVYCTDFRSASLIIFDLKLLLPWYLFVSVLILIERQRKSRKSYYKWAAPSEFGTYRLCEQRRFRRACASAQSHQNLRCSLIQAVNQEEPSDRKPDPWPLWMAGHAQLKFVMTEWRRHKIAWRGSSDS